MNKVVFRLLCGLATVVFSLTWCFAGQPRQPSADKYRPNHYIRNDLERFYILRVETSIWRDGSKRQGWLSGLPWECWAIQYKYVWNDESQSEGHTPGTPDEEPVIVYVSDEGAIVGVQSRWHNIWLPIWRPDARLRQWDFVDGTHVRIGFAVNIHTPGAGLGATAGVLLIGNFGADLSKAFAQFKNAVQRGIVRDCGH